MCPPVVDIYQKVCKIHIRTDKMSLCAQTRLAGCIGLVLASAHAASTLPVLRAAGRAGRALGPIGGGALEVSIIQLGGLSLIRGLD